MTHNDSHREPRPIDTILVATDFGQSATAALEHAIALAERFDAAVDVLHVWSRTPRPFGGIALEVAGQPPRSVNQITQENAQEGLEQLLLEHGSKSERIRESLLREGDTADTILQTAHEGDYDLVTMGTRGRSGVGRMLAGSIAEQVLRHARCPVLMVPYDAVEPEQDRQ